LSDPIAAVRELLDMPEGEPWKPEAAGEEVVGMLRARSTRSSEHSKDYPLLVIETTSGAWVGVHAFHQVLWEEIMRQDPQVGDAIGIRYLGRDDSGRYERYRLATHHVERPAGPTGGPLSSGAASAVPASGAELGANPGGATPPPTDEGPGAGTRVDAWTELLERCRVAGLSVHGVLVTATGKHYTASNAPNAELPALRRAIEWLATREVA